VHHGAVDFGDGAGGGGIGAHLEIKVIATSISGDAHGDRCACTEHRINRVQLNCDWVARCIAQLGTPPSAIT
jgi:hypothetical protein